MLFSGNGPIDRNRATVTQCPQFLRQEDIMVSGMKHSQEVQQTQVGTILSVTLPNIINQGDQGCFNAIFKSEAKLKWVQIICYIQG